MMKMVKRERNNEGIICFFTSNFHMPKENLIISQSYANPLNLRPWHKGDQRFLRKIVGLVAQSRIFIT